jgi:predicted ArsR family transcriptional regulator
MGETDSELTDLHMLVLALFDKHAVQSVEEAAAKLGVSERKIGRLLADLEAEGLIRSLAIH